MSFEQGRIGPWPGGLNWRDSQADPTSVGNGQLRQLINLDPTTAGALVARPGARKVGSPAMYTQLGAAGKFTVLGSVKSGLAASALVCAHDGILSISGGTSRIYFSSTPWLNTNADWKEPTTAAALDGNFAASVQYAGKLYLVPSPTTPGSVTGYSRDGNLAFLDAWVAVPNMPGGDEATVIRERMFVVDRDASRIYWSKATDPTVWAAPDGGSVDVNPGDGEAIYSVAVINSQLYVFKGSRTYLFTFGADPALDGQLTLINDQLGGLDCKAFENSVLVANASGIYRLTNNYFSRMDELVPVADLLGSAVSTRQVGTRVALEGDDTLVVSVLGGGLAEKAMACNLRTGAWSLRRYPEDALVPASRYATTWTTTAGTFAIPNTWNVYGSATRVLVASPVGPAALRSNSTLDLMTTGAVVSPFYQLITGAADGRSPDTYKRFGQVAVQLRNQLHAADAVVQLRRYAAVETAGAVDYDLDTVRQTGQVPAGAWGGKVTALEHVRALAIGHGLEKAQTTLGGVSDPLTASDLTVRGMTLAIDARGGSERT